MSENRRFVLSCCSTADLSADHFKNRDISYICFHYALDGVEYPDDLGQSMSFDDFYTAMAAGAVTKTSQVNIKDYVAYFSSFLEQGLDVLHITLSSGISGSYNSACTAQGILQDTFPDRKILVVDSLGASSGYGLLMDHLADKRDQGLSIRQVYEEALKCRLQLHHWFFSTDLTFYIKGGRISKGAGLVGTLLNICPLLNMDDTGHLIPRQKIRTKKAVIKAIVDQMKLHAQKGLDYDGKCYISMSACPEDARAVADLVEQAFPKLNGKVLINNIGTVIGSHTGPGTVALFFFGDTRTA